MEIERKYLIRELPENLETYAYHDIEQAYLCTAPVVRIRRQDDRYILTYKSSGMMAHEEYNLPLTREAYEHLKAKADGNVITKRRYLIPLDDVLTIELDLFSGTFAWHDPRRGGVSHRGSRQHFHPPDWFIEDVTFKKEYHNSYLSSVALT